MPVIGDGVNALSVPNGLDGYAGYLPGSGYPDYAAMVADHPGKPVLRVTTNLADNADLLDIERGAATVGNAPSWNVRQRAAGLARPADYISVAAAQDLVDFLASAGEPRSSFWLFTAHYTRIPHLCGPTTCAWPGLRASADATQYLNNPGFDLSLVSDPFFAWMSRSAAPAALPPHLEEDMFVAVTPSGKCYLCCPGTGIVIYIGQPTDEAGLATVAGQAKPEPLSVEIVKACAWSAHTPASSIS